MYDIPLGIASESKKLVTFTFYFFQRGFYFVSTLANSRSSVVSLQSLSQIILSIVALVCQC